MFPSASCLPSWEIVNPGARRGGRGSLCLYELEDEDSEAVISVFGPNVLKGKTFTRKTYYGKANSKFLLVTDESAARNHLADNPALPDDPALHGASLASL